ISRKRSNQKITDKSLYWSAAQKQKRPSGRIDWKNFLLADLRIIKSLLAARRQIGKDAFKTIFVDHRCHGVIAVIVQRAHHAAGAIYLNVRVSPQDGSGQHNAEANYSSDTQRALGVKQDAACGDIGGFSKVLMGIGRANGNGKTKRKPD